MAKAKKPRGRWSLDDLKRLVTQIDSADLREGLADYPEIAGSCYFGSGVLPRIRLTFTSVKVSMCKQGQSDLGAEQVATALKILRRLIKKHKLKPRKPWSEDNSVYCVIGLRGKCRDKLQQTGLLAKRLGAGKLAPDFDIESDSIET